MSAQTIGSIESGEPNRWVQLGLCREVDNDGFFPEKGGSTREAKKVCTRCEVQTECLQEALDQDTRFGIWGGKSERERRKIKRQLETEPEQPAPVSLVSPAPVAAHANDPEIFISLGMLHGYITDHGIDDGSMRQRMIDSFPIARQSGGELYVARKIVDKAIKKEIRRIERSLEALIPLPRLPQRSHRVHTA